MASRESLAIRRDIDQLFGVGSFVGLADAELLDTFARRADGAEGAFEAILERHGTAVLQACRRVGGDESSAEDAFQATFIVLARKAGSIRVGDSLRPWLLEVARRTALKGLVGDARRRTRERGAAIPEAIDSPGGGLTDEERSIVRAEVDRLPAKLREPVRLFYLEGRTQQETADALGWPVGSVSGRLSEARKRLRARLARRGLAPSSGWLALPAPEGGTTVSAALRLATLASATASPSVTSAAANLLAARVLRGMAATKLAMKAACAAVAVVVLGVRFLVFAGPPEPLTPAIPPPAEATVEKAGPVESIPVDRYGDPLPKGAVTRLGSTRFRLKYFEDGERMSDLYYSPDGRSLVTVASANTLIWDVGTGHQSRRIEGHRAALSPDGTILATVTRGSIQLRDFRDGREIRRVQTRPGESFDRLAFSADGKTLAAIGTRPVKPNEGIFEAAVVGFETRGLNERFRRPGNFTRARALVFAPDGRSLAIAIPDREPGGVGFWMDEPDRAWICLLDSLDGSEIRRITVDRFDVASLAFSPDGKTLAAGVGDRTVRLYDPATGEERRPRLGEDHAMPAPKAGERARKWYEDAARAASALAFSPDGTKLVSGQEGIGYLNGRVDEASIVVWDVPRRQELHRAFGHYGGINRLAFSPDGKTFASCGGDLSAKIWDPSTGREADPRPGHRATPYLLAVSPRDGTVYTGGSYDDVVLGWNPATGQNLGTILDVPAGILTIDVSPDGASLLIDTWDGLTLWDLATRREVRRFSPKRPSHSGFYRAHFSPDGQTVAMELKVWETATGQELASFAEGQPDWPVNPRYCCARYTPDGRQLVSVETKGIRVLDIASKSVAATPVRRDIPDPTRAALSPDGRLVAVGNYARMSIGFPQDAEPDLPVRVYEVATGREVLALEGHVDQITSLAFSPDGRTLATAAGNNWHPKDRTVRIWDARNGRELKRIEVGENGARQVAYLPHGRAIVSLGMDGVAIVWDIADVAARP